MSKLLSSPAARDRYHHGDLRNALLETGRTMARAVGPDALTLRGVAREAGVSHAAAYKHFADKNDLLRGLAIRAFDDLAQALYDTVATTEGGLEDIAVAYLRFAAAHSAEFRFMFRRELCGPEGEPDPLEAASRHAQGALRERLEVLQERGELGEGDADELLLTAWSHMHGLTAVVLETPAFKGVPAAAAEELVRRSVHRLLAGIGGERMRAASPQS